MIIKNLNLKSAVAVAVLAVSSAFFTGCQKEQVTGNGGSTPSSVVSLDKDQKRMIGNMVERMPVIRVYDEVHNRFIDVVV